MFFRWLRKKLCPPPLFRERAQSVPAPVTTYALFKDGKFLTQSIQTDKKFLKLAGIQVEQCSDTE